jgi:hypothetical protein
MSSSISTAVYQVSDSDYSMVIRLFTLFTPQIFHMTVLCPMGQVHKMKEQNHSKRCHSFEKNLFLGPDQFWPPSNLPFVRQPFAPILATCLRQYAPAFEGSGEYIAGNNPDYGPSNHIVRVMLSAFDSAAGNEGCRNVGGTPYSNP